MNPSRSTLNFTPSSTEFESLTELFAGVAELVLGIVHGRADYIVIGIVIGLSMWWIVRTTWRNLRLALTDYREVKGGGSLR